MDHSLTLISKLCQDSGLLLHPDWKLPRLGFCLAGKQMSDESHRVTTGACWSSDSVKLRITAFLPPDIKVTGGRVSLVSSCQESGLRNGADG